MLEIEPLQFVQHVVHTIERWPERTVIGTTMLDLPHAYGLTADGDTVTFHLFNGEATYQIRRDMPADNGFVADLVEGSAKKTSRKV